MTLQEFQNRDLALQEQIANYRKECFQMQADIAHNEIEITRLEYQRTELRHDFAMETETQEQEE